MSDYLWDKTGEPEEDVKRLEELLSGLSFQPRTFEVPATLPVVPRRAARAAGNFSWQRLAVAASLILTLLAGAWLVFTKQKTTSATPQVVNNVVVPNNEATPQRTPERTTPNENQLARGATSNDSRRVKDERREVVGQIAASGSSRRQRHEFISAAQKHLPASVRQSNARDVNATQEQVAINSQADATTLTTEEKEAMSKFLLAMRVTSEKLSYAERQVQSLRESSPQR